MLELGPSAASDTAAAAVPLIEVRDVERTFTTREGTLRAVDGVSFGVGRGESVAVVGESGSGKSTLARLLVGLLQPTGGSVLYGGAPVSEPATRTAMRRRVSMVFQDPYDALDPRMSVGRAIAEPLVIHASGTRATRRARVGELLDAVGLDPAVAEHRPERLSGGQRQRVSIARAIALDPELLVLDEPVSGLDVSVQAQVLNVIADLRERLGLALLLISHDLAVVRHVADRVLVMYAGRIVEAGSTLAVFETPCHPYTAALLSSVLDVEEEGARILLSGDPPDPRALPSGCRFRERCFREREQCATEEPRLTGGEHPAACLFPGPPGSAPWDDLGRPPVAVRARPGPGVNA